MDKLTPEQRKKNMRAVKSKGSKIERLLAKEFWSNGLRYRKNDKTVFGNPDFVFKGLKIAVFCDSEFWHGKDWRIRKYDFKSNQKFWLPKIERNIQRDKEVNEKLLKDGWRRMTPREWARLQGFIIYLGVPLSGRAFRSNLFVRSSQKGFPLQSLTQNAAA